jgi:hypothetical protein
MTLDVFVNPSSLGSGRAIVPGLNLFNKLECDWISSEYRAYERL